MKPSMWTSLLRSPHRRSRAMPALAIILAASVGAADTESPGELQEGADDLVWGERFREAEGLYLRALQAEDAGPLERTTIWRALADIYLQQGDDEAGHKALNEALEQYDQAQRNDSQLDEVATGLSTVLVIAGREEEAIAIWKKLARGRLEDAAYHLLSAGAAYQRIGDLTAAQDAYRRAHATASIWPDSYHRRTFSYRALTKIAELQMEMEKKTEALRTIEEAIEDLDERSTSLGLVEMLKFYQSILEEDGRTADAQRIDRWRKQILETMKPLDNP